MAKAPRGSGAKVSMLMDAVPGREGETVADPYHGDESDFESAWEEISLAVGHLVERLKAETSGAA
jgi:protein-tyrosine phosphatase